MKNDATTLQGKDKSTVGIASIVLGIIGLAASCYYDANLQTVYDEIGPVSKQITLIKYDASIRNLLIALGVVGLVCGFYTVIRRRFWWSLIGVVLCAFNLVELLVRFWSAYLCAVSNIALKRWMESASRPIEMVNLSRRHRKTFEC